MKHFVDETSCAVFQKKCSSKKVYGKKGEGGVSKYSVEKNFSQIAETFRRGTLYSFISFGCRKYLCFRGLYHDFPTKIFRLTVLRSFVGEPFSLLFISGIEYIYASEGFITIFRRNFFVSQCRGVL